MQPPVNLRHFQPFWRMSSEGKALLRICQLIQRKRRSEEEKRPPQSNHRRFDETSVNSIHRRSLVFLLDQLFGTIENLSKQDSIATTTALGGNLLRRRKLVNWIKIHRRYLSRLISDQFSSRWAFIESKISSRSRFLPP